MHVPFSSVIKGLLSKSPGEQRLHFVESVAEAIKQPGIYGLQHVNV